MPIYRRTLLVVAALAVLAAACRPGSPTDPPQGTTPTPTQAAGSEATPAVTSSANPTATAALAGQDEPPDYVTRLIDALTACATLARNQVCFGHGAVALTLQPGAAAQPFGQPGDVIDLSDVAALSVGGDGANWGVAVLSLEAGLAAENENLTAFVMGPVELSLLDLALEVEGDPGWIIEPDTGEETAAEDLPNPLTFEPVQRLSLTSGAPAAQGWPAGLLMWTPLEGGLASFELNGVNVRLGSTALVEANPALGLTLATLEGTAVLTVGDNSGIVPGGGQASVPLDAEGYASGPITIPAGMDPRAEAIAHAVAQYGVVPPIDPRAEAISAAVDQYHPELAEPDPWMDRVLTRAYAGWLERAVNRCTSPARANRSRYVYNVLYWDTVLDRMGSDAEIDEILGQGARARLDAAARRCLTFEIDFGSYAEVHAQSLTYMIDLESEGLPLHVAPTGYLETADDAIVSHALFEVIGEEAPACTNDLITEDGQLIINGLWLRINVNAIRIGIDFRPEVPLELVRYYCPTGTHDVPLAWQVLFGGAYGEMTIPETGAIRFANWRVTQGEHFAETIEERPITLDGGEGSITAYFTLVHTPLPPP
jgi:hypothetical protein